MSAFAAIVVLGGCVSAGNAALKDVTNETLSEELKEGMSMAEVRSALGDPIDVSFTDGGLSIWNYERVEAQMTAESFIPIVGLFTSGVEGTKTQLVILFDEEDKVRKFTLSDSDYESKSGLMAQ
ncbi:MAG: hypothetical protein AAFV37_03310 [Pseudomonadota bacterium]